jgi:hypothetical protein
MKERDARHPRRIDKMIEFIGFAVFAVSLPTIHAPYQVAKKGPCTPIPWLLTNRRVCPCYSIEAQGNGAIPSTQSSPLGSD